MTRTLIERWTATGWKIVTSRMPAGSGYGDLQAVSCPSASACMTVGSYYTSSGFQAPLAERWNGISWQLTTMPGYPGQAIFADMRGVSCTSATACLAVGDYNYGTPGDTPFAEVWNGTGWRMTRPPVFPVGAMTVDLLGVSCISATTCTAVGASDRGPLIEAWNGTSWRVTGSTVAIGSSLNAVSCKSATACVAVGHHASRTFTETAFSERWNGRTWSILTTPSPTRSSSTALSGLSCTSAAWCVAVGVGTFTTSSRTLAERWNGAAWSIFATPTPAGSTDSALGSVSCTATTACMAVGNYDNSTHKISERYGP